MAAKTSKTTRTKTHKRSAVVQRIARDKTNGDATAAGKRMRSKLRALGGKPDTATAKWLKAQGKGNADGNRYADTIPASVMREAGFPLS